MSRATKCYVSAYDLSRVHQSSLYRFASRLYVANFNGALPPGERIVRATWRIDAPEIAVMSDPQISDDGRETSVRFDAQLGGWASMQCEVVTDAGNKLNQAFRIEVRDLASFADEPALQTGPYTVMCSRAD
jgi:hypothetical protein